VIPRIVTESWCHQCHALRPYHAVAHKGTHCTVCAPNPRREAARARRTRRTLNLNEKVKP